MGEAVERLTKLIDSDDRYNIPHADVHDVQIEAMNERFQERKDAIKLVGHRAAEAGISEVRSFEDIVPLLLPHTAYKSYPENWLREERWDRLSKWMDTVSTYRVPVDKVKDAADVDDWVTKLSDNGFFVSCSSGTTGKSAMLVASMKDMERVSKETIKAYSWGSGIKPAKDRRMFGTGAIASVPRNYYSSVGQREALQDPNYAPWEFPIPPLTVGAITKMVVLRKAMAEGTAKPSDIADFEATSAFRAKALEEGVERTADELIKARESKIHVGGLWANLYQIAKAVRDRGYSAKDFNPENSIYVGGGLKRAVLPDDYQEFVFDTFNIRPERNFQNYSMQELQSGMPKCQKGGRYHLPPWLVPLILDKSGDNLLPLDQTQEYEGRAAFFDLSLDGRWGGVISGDKVAIDFRPCACGHKGPTIRDNVQRYADLEGDDKIGCAGTVDAYVRGVA
ncbi:hypothetical protein LWE61_04540 [Sphingobium sufflavum]|uniref:hypothetical protein n=1 Tax=Sphingobium sufflavum TaxID=1129547 RepID=UPI001F3FE767|nr:hypothetical protein [Sphingobium sufflavum]MCE7795825.1 hypothetical protein [Sphingobium sufflavum]